MIKDLIMRLKESAIVNKLYDFRLEIIKWLSTEKVAINRQTIQK